MHRKYKLAVSLWGVDALTHSTAPWCGADALTHGCSGCLLALLSTFIPDFLYIGVSPRLTAKSATENTKALPVAGRSIDLLVTTQQTPPWSVQ